MHSLPELLAPAGSMDALKAAVAAGADAVYLGGRRFGARRHAPNFSLEEMEEAITYCHQRKVRVYVTVNTLIRDEELEEALEFLIRLHEMGADGVLVQDAGLAALARAVVPALPLHASTQMTLHSTEDAAWACDEGFFRMVLARELSAREIAAIGENLQGSGCGLEIFLHGALCYSYSGQCLFSSMLGGRSGNRGTCAQPCRKPYVLLAGNADEYGRPKEVHALPAQGEYLLSPRDLSLYPHLPQILSLPVSALKIEGRMRSPEYVAVVVDVYRKAMDAVAEGRWSPSGDEMDALLLAFNREFTGGYCMGERGRDVMSPDRPGNRGILIGTVSSSDPRNKTITVRLTGSRVPRAGDGVVGINALSGEETGWVVRPPFSLEGDEVRMAFPQPVPPGSPFFLTRSKEEEERARSVIRRPGGTARSVPIDIRIRWEENTPVLTASVQGKVDRISVEVRGEPMEHARTHPLEKDDIVSRLSRTGNTPFSVRDIWIEYPGGLFAPPGVLNLLRRNLLDRLGEALAASYRPAGEQITGAERNLSVIFRKSPSPPPVPTIPILSVYVTTVAGVEAAVEGGCGRVYLEPPLPSGMTPEEWRDGLSSILSQAREVAGKVPLIWKWPRITRHDFLDRAVFALSGEIPCWIDGVGVEGPGAARAVQRNCPSLPLYGGTGLNVYNSCTARVCGKWATSLALSLELSRAEIARLVSSLGDHGGGPELELVVQGRAELMISEDNLPLTQGHVPGEAEWWGIGDRKGERFPLVVDPDGRTHLFNSRDLCLADRLPEIGALGIGSIAIDARYRSPRYTREMAEIYKTALETPEKEVLSALLARARRLAAGGITSGHFDRGLGELG
jgi:putative protease